VVRAAWARALLPARLSAHTCVHTEYETDAVLKLKRLDTPRYVLHTHVSTHTYLTHTHAHTHTHGCTRASTHTQYFSCIFLAGWVTVPHGSDGNLAGMVMCECVYLCVGVSVCVFVRERGGMWGRGEARAREREREIVYPCIHAYIHTNIHTYVHTHTHTYKHTYIHAYMHGWMQCTNMDALSESVVLTSYQPHTKSVV
jgi:hypothetical protein